MDAAKHFHETAVFEYKKYKGLGEKALAQLSDEDMHWKLNDEVNSIAVIIKHLHGNMLSRWTDFLTTDGEKPNRHRDNEFIEKQESKAELMKLWEEGWQGLLGAIEPLSPEDMSKTITIRHEPHTVMQALCRQLTHVPYHIGQIVHIAKERKGEAFQTLTIPRGKSEEFFNGTYKKG
jgi:hypothetical protein